jgi:hypothetical protein
MFKSFTVSDKKIPVGNKRSAGGKQSPTEPATPPGSVQRAVMLMYGGAATGTVYLITVLATMGSLKSALVNANKTAKHPLTASQINGEATGYIIYVVLVGVVSVALWLWMARVNGQGKGWARIVATVMFCLWTIDTVDTVAQNSPILAMLFPVIAWLFGLGAVFLLWRPDSTAFIKSR